MLSSIEFKTLDPVYVQDVEDAFFEQLHRCNGIPWTANMTNFLGKGGVVRGRREDIIDVTYYTCVADPSVATAFKIVETTISWHVTTLRRITSFHFMPGDHVAYVRDEQFENMVVAGVCAIEQNGEVTVLRATNWKNPLKLRIAEGPRDALLPIYVGPTLGHLMRSRTECSTSTSLLTAAIAEHDGLAVRAIFGRFPLDAEPTAMVDATVKWIRTGDERVFYRLYRVIPEMLDLPINGKTPLIVAAEMGSVQVVTVLLTLQADKMPRHVETQNTLLHVAAEKGHSALLHALVLMHPETVNEVNVNRETPLHVAVLSAHTDSVDHLISCTSLDINAQDADGNTAMHLIALMNDSPGKMIVVKRLVEHKHLKFYLQNTEGFTSLEYAIVKGQDKVVEAIVKSKPRLLMAKGEESMLPIHLAAAFARKDVLAYTTDEKNRRTRAGRTALHSAVERWTGNIEKDMQRLACIHMLLNEALEINARDCNGETAAHLLMRELRDELPDQQILDALRKLKRSDVALLDLVSCARPCWRLATACYFAITGADLTIRNCLGQTALDLVEDPSVRSLLGEFASGRKMSCLPMSSSRWAEFDESRVAICTFSCDENPANVKLMPCGHMVICLECLVKTPLRRCPLCFNQVASMQTKDGREMFLYAGEDGRVLLKQAGTDEPIDVTAMDKRAAAELKAVEELRAKLESLQSRLNCPICMDARCSVAFNCGHTTCADCGKLLKVCHLCRQPITSRQVIYQ